MTRRICSIDDCLKVVDGNGYCKAHNSRFRRNGDPLGGRPSGPRFCSVDTCERRYYSLGYCQMHYSRFKTHGDPLKVVVYDNRVSHTSYGLAHSRLASARGRAATHRCVDCGGPAEDWSYDGGDPNERMSDKGRPFSEDFSRYSPRCKPCHRHFDWVAVNPACQQGHEYTAENTLLSGGRRLCRECNRTRARRNAQRKRDAA